MKILGHPIHVMLIHFPAALLPMELVCYYIFFSTGDASFATASFYAMCSGTLLGWLAVVTGALDLILIKGEGELQAKALIHGLVNSTVITGYTVIALVMYKHYPALPAATTTLLIIKAAFNIVMIAGNYLGGNLVLKYKIGVQK